MTDLFVHFGIASPMQAAPEAPRARFKTLAEYRCEACGGSVSAVGDEVRIFAPTPGSTRAWCSPVCAGWK